MKKPRLLPGLFFFASPCLSASLRASPPPSVPLCASPCLSVPLRASPPPSVPLRLPPCLSAPLRASPCLSVPLRASPCLSVPLRVSPCLSVPLRLSPCPPCLFLLPRLHFHSLPKMLIKIFLKTFQKPLDNLGKLCYNEVTKTKGGTNNAKNNTQFSLWQTRP